MPLSKRLSIQLSLFLIDHSLSNRSLNFDNASHLEAYFVDHIPGIWLASQFLLFDLTQ